jgi:hypothetical protein
MDNVCASKRTATNDKTAPIKKNVVAEDVIAIVDSISNWVAKYCGESTNVASIIDISVVSAVGSLIHCAINHNAVTIENNGLDKLAITINNALSHNTISHIDGLNSKIAKSNIANTMKSLAFMKVVKSCTMSSSRVAIHHTESIHQVTIIDKSINGDIMSAIGTTSNDDVISIKKDTIVEDSAAIIETKRIAVKNWATTYKTTIVDISTMSAATAFICSSINDDTVTVIRKVCGNDKTMSMSLVEHTVMVESILAVVVTVKLLLRLSSAVV